MLHVPTLLRTARPANNGQSRAESQRMWVVPALASALLSLLMAVPRPALAVDGCTVLLCFAAPSWRAIPQCVPPIRKVLRDLALGRAFPTCGMSGPGNSAAHQWANPPSFCPPQYTQVINAENHPEYLCSYVGAVEVMVKGDLWTRTWWRMDGDSVTEYTPAAKAQLGSWDTRFDDDYAAWLANQPPPPPPCEGC
jgi:hypothetical protein